MGSRNCSAAEPPRPIRLGLLFEYPTLNGGERSLLAVLDQLRPDRLEAVAFAPDAGPLNDELRGRGIPHVSIAWRSPDGTRRSIESLAAELLPAIQEHRLDLLHANSLAMGRLLGGLVGRLPCPTTSHLRDILTLSRGALADLNRHRRLIAVSRATLDFHLRQGLCAERVITVHNGVDLEQFRPRPRTGVLRRELELPNGAVLAGTIGQICLRKGQNDLADAAVLLRDRCPQLHFLLIGQRHSTKAESIAADARITGTFASAGMLRRLHRLGERTDVPVLLGELDLLVHPARQEPLGRVLLEAAAAGTPIVATRVGGTEEILTHGENAWLVPAGDPQSLAEGIVRVLSDPRLRQEFGRRARTVIEARFPISLCAERTLNVWSDVLRELSMPDC